MSFINIIYGIMNATVPSYPTFQRIFSLHVDVGWPRETLFVFFKFWRLSEDIKLRGIREQKSHFNSILMTY
ncbi:hypothetical protein CAEBREN_01432 [Caenorhabditis brenneri]|uniref:Uncharacterized protein n=1 Tax=Caenorhabditis brenneri TaxID=135651 RepID=G0MVJ4_CAEBE|nr:hypothetical protein CAEBREN_01432 [Caenorhabditis brenneri]